MGRPVLSPFRPVTDTPPGRHPLLTVFRGLEGTVPFRKYPGDDERILAIARATWVLVTDAPGWMYVAPRTTPAELRGREWRPLMSRDDAIVVARSHLTNSPPMDLYLDILHEFYHILQRRQGRELWPGAAIPYVDRPTEVEAYAFSVAEARRLGESDAYLREYLKVDWLTRPAFRRLLSNVGVPAA